MTTQTYTSKKSAQAAARRIHGKDYAKRFEVQPLAVSVLPYGTTSTRTPAQLQSKFVKQQRAKAGTSTTPCASCIHGASSTESAAE